MGSLARFNVATLVARHKITQFVETGYGLGNSCRHALNSGMGHALSCEIHEDLHRKAKQNERLYVAKSDSADFLKSERVQSAIAQQRCLIFLDAQFPGADFGDSSYDNASQSSATRLPLIDELASLKGRAANALIVIDDVRVYRRDFKVRTARCPIRSRTASIRKRASSHCSASSGPRTRCTGSSKTRATPFYGRAHGANTN